MNESTTPDIAAAVAALLAAVGQTQAPAPTAPVTMLTVSETAELLRCSESLIYAQLRDGRLRGVKVGRRRLIPMREIDRLIAGDAAA
ncbi:helix-turn-helix domain-containing protein [Mycobacterium avium]|uniref:DNA binding domain, excisionase family protein n=1 Tax=Mycobacterium avium (strain 104) TaxID=243243 RepID=A0A0H3A145_MYCA1|nr:helix-turn-helix domain-containing protein [Mycobacterium avium]ABK68328.1 DNA binding domain, excisionase family protein [Mycobacterium avium 104]KDP09284.1 DNA-binding protein [Mycobacterium avium subsp. hominissuis 101]MBZ4509048.1 helix-turn-helix domain-containing protein [Mycobacterium avium subsp. hominissuis]MCG3243034.1 helix-turn-helix domain-containing protein [Mycobacterium avium subsp. hominissuis]